MTTNKLADIVKEYEKQKKALNLNLEGWDVRTRAGMLTKRALAKNKIETLTKEYNKEVEKSFVKILATGSLEKQREFANLAESQGALVVSADGLYLALATTVGALFSNAKNARRTFEVAHELRLKSALSDVADKLDLSFKPVKVKRHGAKVPTTQDLLDLIRKVVQDSNGNTLMVEYTKRQLLEGALAKRLAHSVIPVVIYSTTDDEVSDLGSSLFTGRPNIVVDVDQEELSEDLLVKLNQKIIEAVKSNKPNKKVKKNE